MMASEQADINHGGVAPHSAFLIYAKCVLAVETEVERDDGVAKEFSP